MRVIVESKNVVFIEGIIDDGFFWIDNDSLRVNEEKTARLLGCIQNTLSTQKADKALWQWKLNNFTSKDF